MRFGFFLLLGWCAAAPIVSAQQRVITLEEAYERTLTSDQSIQIAYWEIRKGNLLPWSALLSRLGPQITGNGSFDFSAQTNRFTSSSSSMLSSRTVTTTTHTSNGRIGLSFDQTIMDFTVFPAYRLGKLSSKVARLQQTFTIRQTLFGVAQAYYNVLKQQSIVQVNQQTVDLANGQLDLSQKRYNVGDVARTDVARAKATLEDARNALIGSENALAVARNNLGNILNLGGDTGFRVAEPPGGQTELEPFTDMLSHAYANREDYQIARIAVDQDIARHNIIIGEYGPRLAAQASQDWSAETNAPRSSGNVGSVTFSVQMPFLTGGQREIDLLTTNHQINESRLNFETTGKSIQQEVKNAWLAEGSLREAIKAVTAEVEASLQNYNDLQAQYEAGAAISLDVQTALRDLNNARATLAGDKYDYQVALRDLQRAQAMFQEDRIRKAKFK